MLQLLKRVGWLGVLAVGMPAAQAFVNSGPPAFGGDAWQVPDIGYLDFTAPKNIGEDYRRNTPSFTTPLTKTSWITSVLTVFGRLIRRLRSLIT